jgi:hypothetical protein
LYDEYCRCVRAASFARCDIEVAHPVKPTTQIMAGKQTTGNTMRLCKIDWTRLSLFGYFILMLLKGTNDRIFSFIYLKVFNDIRNTLNTGIHYFYN